MMLSNCARTPPAIVKRQPKALGDWLQDTLFPAVANYPKISAPFTGQRSQSLEQQIFCVLLPSRYPTEGEVPPFESQRLATPTLEGVLLPSRFT